MKTDRCHSCNGFHDEPFGQYNHPFVPPPTKAEEGKSRKCVYCGRDPLTAGHGVVEDGKRETWCACQHVGEVHQQGQHNRCIYYVAPARVPEAKDEVTLHRINYRHGPSPWAQCPGPICGILPIASGEHAVATITRRKA